MNRLKIILSIAFILAFGFSHAQAKKNKKLGYFQKNRAAFEKARYGSTSKKYGKACTIFEKKRTKGEKKPILSGIFRRKSKTKRVAEQN